MDSIRKVMRFLNIEEYKLFQKITQIQIMNWICAQNVSFKMKGLSYLKCMLPTAFLNVYYALMILLW